ncbi:hypothetical protein QIS99_30425 [Streptomyces sp. B-S-A8]|uniref:Oxidoreductase n=1 Tax=Streptomyces solicavernae TaxID=3043614 RepID=A0ABT6S1A9_9ACTN|nr:hypothetical protein [Streptomyces sp. B-S-A8]MDI3390477.1 hypothetical protein [Streptomyces sp. B-S-A8]
MTGPANSPLFRTYRDADRKWSAHVAACQHCGHEPGCPAGQPLFNRFAELQSAYLDALSRRDNSR